MYTNCNQSLLHRYVIAVFLISGPLEKSLPDSLVTFDFWWTWKKCRLFVCIRACNEAFEIEKNRGFNDKEGYCAFMRRTLGCTLHHAMDNTRFSQVVPPSPLLLPPSLSTYLDAELKPSQKLRNKFTISLDCSVTFPSFSTPDLFPLFQARLRKKHHIANNENEEDSFMKPWKKVGP